VTLLMMTAVIWCCVFNLFWAESCRVFAFSGMLLVTFFIQSLQTFLILVTFCYFFERFLHLCSSQYILTTTTMMTMMMTTTWVIDHVQWVIMDRCFSGSLFASERAHSSSMVHSLWWALNLREFYALW